MCLTLTCGNNVKEVTIELRDSYLGANYIFISPDMVDNGIMNILLKKRIIKEVVNTIFDNKKLIPIVTINNNILRSYDYKGVNKYLDVIQKENYDK